jgi:hypothetical protein
MEKCGLCFSPQKEDEILSSTESLGVVKQCVYFTVDSSSSHLFYNIFCELWYFMFDFLVRFTTFVCRITRVMEMWLMN